MFPSLGSDDYGKFLDEIIENLMSVKSSLKRGRLRKENRKEIDQLHAAIKACRHLKKKNLRKQQVLLNSSEELVIPLKEANSFTSGDIRKFLYGVIRNDDETF